MFGNSRTPFNIIMDKVGKGISAILEKLEINNAQIQTLKQTRDTLLPKLMSGQLRVDEFKEGAACM
jgi:type I restriction enzyme S subunit